MIDAKTLTNASDIARAFCNIDADRDAVMRAFVRLVDTDCTYDKWEGFRKNWGEGYKSVPTRANATDDAINTAWSRFVRCVKNYAAEQDFPFDIPAKPKSESADAVKKAEQRANPFEGKTAPELKTAIQAITGTDLESAETKLKAMRALAKLEKAEEKAKQKTESEKLAPRIKVVTDFVKKAPVTTLALFEALTDMTSPNASAASIAAAWRRLATLAPNTVAPKADKVRRAA